jgi:translation elongation factor EF-4
MSLDKIRNFCIIAHIDPVVEIRYYCVIIKSNFTTGRAVN